MKRALLAVCGVLLSMPALAGGHGHFEAFGHGAGVFRPSEGISPPTRQTVIVDRLSEGISPPTAHTLGIGRPFEGISPPTSHGIGRVFEGISPPTSHSIEHPTEGISPPTAHTVSAELPYGPLVRPAWE